MRNQNTRNPKRTLAVDVLVTVFFFAGWYLQRDKIESMSKEKHAQQEEGKARLAYQDCIINNTENI